MTALPLRNHLDRARYQARHRALAAALSVPLRLWHLALGPDERRPRREVTVVRRRFLELLHRDLQNVADGYYPRELLFSFPLGHYASLLPTAMSEMARVLARKHRRRWSDVPGAEAEWYPRYYRRTFHWQTDGWLSPRSARLYDASVEFLFMGTADIMRRMVIPPVVDEVWGQEYPRVLDLACGTGRLLKMLQAALPEARLSGVDLSPYYLSEARRLLGDDARVSLLAENAERTPLEAGSQDAVVSSFLFHELPSDARRRVMAEAWRLLRPGGVLAVCDSAQLTDSPEIGEHLTGFPRLYHEPFFKGYLRDDLAGAMRRCGFEIVTEAPWLVSKVVVGRKSDVQ